MHAENHIASLVVGLPYKHEGGKLLVSNKNVKDEIDFYRENLVVWGAFFTDCHHEVEKVTSGTRITL